ncbi:DUF262 domain-containing protein [Turicibacter sanguinis]|nr:DUF262 domain-containing protein [Turicibacter sanguinis]MTN51464.1 DUF262 domain-containing protein [Turicibacter sanguinis]MTN54662.1 DUF262 domain-containing protein [Turicibacter sanguinis]MTN57745.1 DUF262 domain-containing protein [Turicibacter sanguinis]MTN60860.1 DUF262 domain-containing protein [Turicibacter sanguinis]
MQKQIDYDTKDYTIELLVDKFSKKDFFIPNYQREFIWPDKNRSLFLESIFLGLPIPFMFFAYSDDFKYEIIDGAQRMQTISGFFNNEIKLSGLKKLTKLNDFYFKDLSEAQQRRFINKTLRIIVLDENTPIEARKDLFYRINTSGVKANDSEIRRGSYQGPFIDFLDKCSKDPEFVELVPMSQGRVDRYERFELVLRYFAYLNEYENFDHTVNEFLDEYLLENLKEFNEQVYITDFKNMLRFVRENFPLGFKKSANAKSVPRVRFEAISVGVGLALRENPKLVVSNLEWLESDRFKKLTTSDGSNNQGRLKARVEYVKQELLKS